MKPHPSLIGFEVDSGEAGKLVRCAAVLGLVIVYGTVGYYFIEGWPLGECLYFTLVTITTVGYEDAVTSSTGKVFTSFLLLLGIGTFTFTLGEMVKTAVAIQAGWKKKMLRKISELEGHVIVCGFGRLGRTICEALQRAGLPQVIIEQDEHIWQQAIDEGYLAIRGSSAEDEFLMEAGIERSRGIVCAVDSDAENIFTVLTARAIKPDLLVASRANSMTSVKKLERAGATVVVSPHHTAGVDIARAIVQPKLAELLSASPRHGYGIEMTEVPISAGSHLAGRSIRDAGMEINSIVFIALQRGDEKPLVRPGGNETFEAGDVVIVAGTAEDLSQMHRFAKPQRGAA